MKLFQLLLPLADNDGKPFGQEEFKTVQAELVEKFGGVTAFLSAPGRGLWDKGGGVVKDDIALFEVMAETVERDWWHAYQRRLEERFRQDRIVIRIHTLETLDPPWQNRHAP